MKSLIPALCLALCLKMCGVEINNGYEFCPLLANNLAFMLKSWYSPYVFKAFISAQVKQCLPLNPPGRACVWL